MCHRILASLSSLLGSLAFLCALPSWAEIRVVDGIGREVVLERPAASIISLAPHNTENLFTAGAGEKVVGVVNHSDYPPAARQIPLIGTHVQFNLELIVSMKPDLIVAWQSGNAEEVLRRLEELGFPIYVSQPFTIDDIVGSIENLARLAGTQDAVDPELGPAVRKLEELRRDHAHKRPVEVFYQVWTEPLITLNGRHILSQALGICGAKNIFGQLPMLAPRISIESVLDINPEAIVTDLVDGRVPDMSYWENWSSIRAVQRQNYVFLDPDVMFRPTLRMLKGIPDFCAELDLIRTRQESPQS
ncbi:MAG: cobalamin-binding protein [Gammaproteobacteria bacterium]|nr:cobalamin-binding protein [Gammaproteobacteria bacterium]MYD75948.1 cobalamin-binding protein [Gammaproteobacteria bacterium]MYJ52808.1 cobalamin-binding protein [Gammaproteobacteria bacterium]